MGFVRDLGVGKQAENRVRTILERVFDKIEPSVGKESGYDLLCTKGEKALFVEVKHDLYASKSGNIAIETYNPKSFKPSGITATKSDFWAYVVDNDIHIIPLLNLLQFMILHHPHKVVSVGGDGNASLYLYRMDVILPKFTQISESSTNEELESVLWWR